MKLEPRVPRPVMTEPRTRTVFDSKCFTANYYAKDKKLVLCHMVILIFCLAVMWWKGLWSCILLQWRGLLWLASDACHGWMVEERRCTGLSFVPYKCYSAHFNTAQFFNTDQQQNLLTCQKSQEKNPLPLQKGYSTLDNWTFEHSNKAFVNISLFTDLSFFLPGELWLGCTALL